MHSDSILALLWWDFAKTTTEYNGKLYRVDALLNDPKLGALWLSKSNIVVNFGYQDKKVVVTNCFCHVACKQLFVTGEPFHNFM